MRRVGLYAVGVLGLLWAAGDTGAQPNTGETTLVRIDWDDGFPKYSVALDTKRYVPLAQATLVIPDGSKYGSCDKAFLLIREAASGTAGGTVVSPEIELPKFEPVPRMPGDTARKYRLQGQAESRVSQDDIEAGFQVYLRERTVPATTPAKAIQIGWKKVAKVPDSELPGYGKE